MLYLYGSRFILGRCNPHTSISEMLKAQNDITVFKSLGIIVAANPAKVFPLCLENICSTAGVDIAGVRLSMLENWFCH